MKKYMEPEMKVEELHVEDIIATSNGGGSGAGSDFGGGGDEE